MSEKVKDRVWCVALHGPVKTKILKSAGTSSHSHFHTKLLKVKSAFKLNVSGPKCFFSTGIGSTANAQIQAQKVGLLIPPPKIRPRLNLGLFFAGVPRSTSRAGSPSTRPQITTSAPVLPGCHYPAATCPHPCDSLCCTFSISGRDSTLWPLQPPHPVCTIEKKQFIFNFPKKETSGLLFGCVAENTKGTIF